MERTEGNRCRRGLQAAEAGERSHRPEVLLAAAGAGEEPPGLRVGGAQPSPALAATSRANLPDLLFFLSFIELE